MMAATDTAASGPDLPTADADRFGRARAARSTVLAEDYVELIADLLATGGEARTAAIARRQGVSHASVIKTVSRLKRAGLVTGQPYGSLFLTDAGRELADSVRARHRLVLRMLLALGVPERDALADAEGIEHHVSANTLNAFARFLDRAG